MLPCRQELRAKRSNSKCRGQKVNSCNRQDLTILKWAFQTRLPKNHNNTSLNIAHSRCKWVSSKLGEQDLALPKAKHTVPILSRSSLHLPRWTWTPQDNSTLLILQLLILQRTQPPRLRIPASTRHSCARLWSPSPSWWRTSRKTLMQTKRRSNEVEARLCWIPRKEPNWRRSQTLRNHLRI